MPRPQILDAAAAELAEAAAYLEEERPGYARRFLRGYEAKLRQIARFPQSGPLIENSPKGVELRVFSMRTFRYSLIVGVFQGAPMIVAVAHEGREPGYWRERLK